MAKKARTTPAVGFALYSPKVVALAFTKDGEADPEVEVGIYPTLDVIGEKDKQVLLVPEMKNLGSAMSIENINLICVFGGYSDLVRAELPIVDGDRRDDGVVTLRRVTPIEVRSYVDNPPRLPGKIDPPSWAGLKEAVRDVMIYIPRTEENKKLRIKTRKNIIGRAVGLRRTELWDSALSSLKEAGVEEEKIDALRDLVEDTKHCRRLWKAYYRVCAKGYEVEPAAKKSRANLEDLSYIVKIMKTADPEDFIYVP